MWFSRLVPLSRVFYFFWNNTVQLHWAATASQKMPFLLRTSFLAATKLSRTMFKQLCSYTYILWHRSCVTLRKTSILALFWGFTYLSICVSRTLQAQLRSLLGSTCAATSWKLFCGTGLLRWHRRVGYRLRVLGQACFYNSSHRHGHIETHASCLLSPC